MQQADSLIIKGLAGKKTLRGEVRIKGAKNAILKAMAASILFEEAVELRNISDTADIENMKDLLVGLGAKVESKEQRALLHPDYAKASSDKQGFGGQAKSKNEDLRFKIYDLRSEEEMRARNTSSAAACRRNPFFSERSKEKKSAAWRSRQKAVQELELSDNTLDSRFRGNDKLHINASNLTSTDLDPDISRSMRSSIVATGPILARYGKVSFPVPGGCVIGARPIDLFIESYKKMGASVAEKNGVFHITSPKSGLKGADIFFPIQTVTGTETLMMTAVLARGTTTLGNCAMEPEIQSVVKWLNECGAKIEGAGTTTITIHGLLDKALTTRTSLDEAWKKSSKLLKARKPYIAIPDRIEAASFLFLGALCADDLLISNCEPRHLEAVTNFLSSSGALLEIKKDSIHVKGNANALIGKKNSPLKINSSYKSANIRTHEYPGFPTDLQPIAAVFLSQVSGESIIFETIFEGRFKYVDDLNKLGADIKIMNPREILVEGPTLYKALPAGEELMAHDIRAGFAIVLAALLAEGNSVVKNVHLIDRGYESIEKTLTSLGADVRRVYGEEVMDCKM